MLFTLPTMPELPEVETMRRGILPVMGHVLRDVVAPPCTYRPIRIEPALDELRRRAVGRRVSDVGRVGKRVVIALDGGEYLVLQPKMAGLVLMADPPTREHLRLRLVFESPRRVRRDVLYWDRRGLGTVMLLDEAMYRRALGGEAIGPDALAVTCDAFRQRLGRVRREIKVALLDQRLVAGVGNLYASELLFLAGVHPQRRCGALRAAEWRRIHQAMLDVLEQAIRHEGSTLADGSYRNALNEAGGYQNHHRVYDREGRPCVRCTRGRIRRIVQAQRSTFFCTLCQRKRGAMNDDR